MAESVITILSYIYGRAVVERLLGRKIDVEYNKEGRIRRVYIDGKLAFVLRNNDGYLLPTLYGALFIDSKITVSEDAARFVEMGRNVPVKHIKGASGKLRANGEVAVVDLKGRVIAVGRLIYSVRELTLEKGYAVKVREAKKDVEKQELLQ
ncbi:MAG: PUA domain-containing protein [Pyrobaculum sp.]